MDKKFYAIRDTGGFVAFDEMSGGYPYLTYDGFYITDNILDAMNNADPTQEIVELVPRTVSREEIIQVTNSDYQRDLAMLNAKYGR